jgi:hypothetical protein
MLGEGIKEPCDQNFFPLRAYSHRSPSYLVLVFGFFAWWDVNQGLRINRWVDVEPFGSGWA